MLTSKAQIQTSAPERLMTRLCKHWSHKLPVNLGEKQAEIELPAGICRLYCSEILTVELESDHEQMPVLQQVVADHLIRMAGKEEQLVISWQ